MPIDTHAAGAASYPHLPLRVSEPEDRHSPTGAIMVFDAANNDIAEFPHSDQATVGQTYEQALGLAQAFVAATASPAPGALADLARLSKAADAAKHTSVAHAANNPGSTSEGFMLRMRVCDTRNAFRDAAVDYVRTLIASPPAASQAHTPERCLNLSRSRLAEIDKTWNATGRLDEGQICFLIRMAEQRLGTAASAPPVDGGERERIAARLRVAFPDLTQQEAECAAETAFPECLALRPAAGAAGPTLGEVHDLAQRLYEADPDRSNFRWGEQSSRVMLRWATIAREAIAALARHATPDGDSVTLMGVPLTEEQEADMRAAADALDLVRTRKGLVSALREAASELDWPLPSSRRRQLMPEDRMAVADELERRFADLTYTLTDLAIFTKAVLPTILSALRDAGTGRDSGEAASQVVLRELSEDEKQRRAEALADAQRREREAQRGRTFQTGSDGHE